MKIKFNTEKKGDAVTVKAQADGLLQQFDPF